MSNDLLEEVESLLAGPSFDVVMLERTWNLTCRAEAAGAHPERVGSLVERIEGILKDILPTAVSFARSSTDPTMRRHAFETVKQIAMLLALISGERAPHRLELLPPFLAAMDDELVAFETAIS